MDASAGDRPVGAVGWSVAPPMPHSPRDVRHHVTLLMIEPPDAALPDRISPTHSALPRVAYEQLSWYESLGRGALLNHPACGEDRLEIALEV
jgi:hypothetical protein